MQQFCVHSEQFITYLLLLVDNILKVACFICNTLRVTIHKPVKKKLGPTALDLWSQFDPEYDTSPTALCVGDSCIRILSSIETSGIVRSGDPTGHGVPVT